MIVSASASSASSSTCTPSETEGNNGFEIRIALSLRYPRDQRFTRRSAPNLRKNPYSTPNHTMQQAYAAVRAWVWKALDGRRRDPELREWFDVLKRVTAFLRTKDAALAERVVALHELVHESIAVSEQFPVESVLKRRHVRDVLMMLVSAPGGRVDRAGIGSSLGLKQGNLTRILNMVTKAGLAERAVYGKQAEFQLTRAGEAACRRLGFRKAAPAREAGTWRARGAAAPLPRKNAFEILPTIRLVEAVQRQFFEQAGYGSDRASVQAVKAAAGRTLFTKGHPVERPARQVAGAVHEEYGPWPTSQPQAAGLLLSEAFHD
ncbi:hypothetical protein ACQKQD_33225 [Methylobacterium sp. NPDC080182]|uniref:hypothetical protein n=1 Tax=Methylobacterium sp. NPDC080182 TaxID=3390590 RepID=UPI003D07FAF1